MHLSIQDLDGTQTLRNVLRSRMISASSAQYNTNTHPPPPYAPIFFPIVLWSSYHTIASCPMFSHPLSKFFPLQLPGNHSTTVDQSSQHHWKTTPVFVHRSCRNQTIKKQQNTSVQQRKHKEYVRPQKSMHPLLFFPISNKLTVGRVLSPTTLSTFAPFDQCQNFV